MHPLYEAANEVLEQLHKARLEVARLSAQLVQAEYDLRLSQAKAERGLIKKVGSEKTLAPSVEDRERIFTLALDADEEYRTRWRERKEVALKLEEAKAEVARLREKLDVMLAVLRAGEGGSGGLS